MYSRVSIFRFRRVNDINSFGRMRIAFRRMHFLRYLQLHKCRGHRHGQSCKNIRSSKSIVPCQICRNLRIACEVCVDRWLEELEGTRRPTVLFAIAVSHEHRFKIWAGTRGAIWWGWLLVFTPKQISKDLRCLCCGLRSVCEERRNLPFHVWAGTHFCITHKN